MYRYDIVDNFLKEKDYLEIKKTLFDINFPWYMTIGVAKPNANDGYYFSHSFIYNYLHSGTNYKKLINPLITKLNPSSLINCKANLYPGTPKIIEHAKHQDMQQQHKGFIYYINTNNGYTLLEDGTKIESIANRGLYFDSNKPHASTTCSDQLFRVNLNFNYM